MFFGGWVRPRLDSFTSSTHRSIQSVEKVGYSITLLYSCNLQVLKLFRCVPKILMAVHPTNPLYAINLVTMLVKWKKKKTNVVECGRDYSECTCEQIDILNCLAARMSTTE